MVSLQGFSDAGNAVAQLDRLLWSKHDPAVIVRFDNDLFLDYRARRPTITFVEDRLVDYEPATLTLSLAHDELGAPFLLLSGYEPDFAWERFIDEVLFLVHEFEVSATTWVHAIPMPVPHTRPIGATVSGSREDLIAQRSVWQPTTKLAASIGHVLEHRLHHLGEEIVGFVLLVPHYLANTDYPHALLAGLESIMAATGLLFATDDVARDAGEFLAQVDEQVDENTESSEMVRGLEARYDRFMEDRAAGTAEEEDRMPLLADEQPMPTAEQLASELESFLAERQRSEPGDAEDLT